VPPPLLMPVRNGTSGRAGLVDARWADARAGCGARAASKRSLSPRNCARVAECAAAREPARAAEGPLRARPPAAGPAAGRGARPVRADAVPPLEAACGEVSPLRCWSTRCRAMASIMDTAGALPPGVEAAGDGRRARCLAALPPPPAGSERAGDAGRRLGGAPASAARLGAEAELLSDRAAPAPPRPHAALAAAGEGRVASAPVLRLPGRPPRACAAWLTAAGWGCDGGEPCFCCCACTLTLAMARSDCRPASVGA